MPCLARCAAVAIPPIPAPMTIAEDAFIVFLE
jgi:hypothetical protein